MDNQETASPQEDAALPQEEQEAGAVPLAAQREAVALQGEQEPPAQEQKVVAPSEGPVAWRRDLLAALVAGVAFLILLVLRDILNELTYVGSIVFLPVGLWVGRASRRPLMDGAVYGLLSGLVACLVLLAIEFPLWWGGLVLALPQSFLGVWLGERFWPARIPEGKKTSETTSGK